MLKNVVTSIPHLLIEALRDTKNSHFLDYERPKMDTLHEKLRQNIFITLYPKSCVIQINHGPISISILDVSIYPSIIGPI